MFSLSDDLYFCRFWKGEKKLIDEKQFEVIVSDLIPGPLKNLVIQIHAIILLNGAVARVKDISSNYTIEELRDFEDGLQSIIRERIDSCKNYCKENIRIWYYEPGNAALNVLNYPLRIAITLTNLPNGFDTRLLSNLTSSIYDCIWKWIMCSSLKSKDC